MPRHKSACAGGRAGPKAPAGRGRAPVTLAPPSKPLVPTSTAAPPSASGELASTETEIVWSSRVAKDLQAHVSARVPAVLGRPLSGVERTRLPTLCAYVCVML